jgi:ADP-heptose:LPS heptosyltransferase
MTRGGAKKTLAIFPGALGDFVCFLPALSHLARERRVDLLACTEYGELAPAGISVATIDQREIGRLFVAGAAPEESADFFAQYQLVYSWTGSGDATFRTNFARAAGAAAKLFPFRPAGGAMHMVDYYRGCVGAHDATETPSVALADEALAAARAWLGARGFGGQRTLTVAPGSGGREKNWRKEYFMEVIQWWEREARGKALVVLGPAEDRELSFWTKCAPVAHCLGLAELAALLSLSDVYVGNDSGVTHLAAAAGAVTLAVFGPTDAAQWSPRGRVTIVKQGVDCSPCDHATMKSCPHHDCLETLPPRSITRLLQQILS